MKNIRQYEYDFVIKRYEEKLKTLMGEKDFDEFTTQVAKDLFLREVNDMTNGALKEFILDNLDEIFQESENG